ncbi:MAG: polysaccharide biosynthesis/export family protein [Bryobacteraceae bacterium]
MRVLIALLVAAAAATAFQSNPAANYILGPEDEITVRVLDLEEIDGKTPFRIDIRGNINLPLAGRVHAAGSTAEELEIEIAARLKKLLQAPTVTVAVSEFRSQPVSVLGAVQTPGVQQVRGRKTLFEVISLVGGLKAEAGNSIKITRRKKYGPIPLASNQADASGEFFVAEVKVRGIMDASSPQDNIFIQPEDTISVPKADLVYVTGSVKRSGGFVLNEKESISVLQALSLAEGLDRTAATSKAKILRPSADGVARLEIPIDLKKLMAGQTEDVSMKANDILFVPNSATKAASIRAAEAALQITTGLIIWRR